MERHDWRKFFSEYSRLSLEGDAAELAGHYAEGFVIAEPGGAYGALNDEAFRHWLTQVQSGNRGSGMLSMRPLEADEQPISPHHRLVKVRWGARFRQVPHEIVFEVSYVMVVQGDRPRIVGSISHESQRERMAQEGLLPENVA